MKWLCSMVVAMALVGCTSPCVKLAKKICDCQATQADRDNCNADVSARAGEVNITDQDEATCSALIDTCACHDLNTAQGKRDCGLAR